MNLVRTGKVCEIWEAIDDKTRERCALKLVRPEYNRDREQIRLLRHEYQVGRQLDHPHVIKLYHFFSDRSKTYLAMEYFAAPNMKQLIQVGVKHIAYLAVQVIATAAEGLGYLHQQNYVHRDVKPDNFLIDSQGFIKLIDFALAERPKGALAKMFSLRSKIQGTRSYMSPEQIRGLPVDERADIYSFGCMTYELLTGRAPFTGTNSNDLLNKHLKAPVPTLEAANRNVTPEFSSLVRRMMAKEAKARPQSMTEFLHDFRKIKVFKVPPVPPSESEPEQ